MAHGRVRRRFNQSLGRVSGKELYALSGHQQRIWKLRWSPNDRQLVSASGDNTINLDVARQEAIQTLRGHAAPVMAVCWSPDGSKVASAGFDGDVRVWNTATGREDLPPLHHNGWLLTLSWTRIGNRLAAAGQGGKIRIWDAATGEELRVVSQTGQVGAVAWSPDGSRLASAGFFRGRVRIWNANKDHARAFYLDY